MEFGPAHREVADKIKGNSRLTTLGFVLRGLFMVYPKISPLFLPVRCQQESPVIQNYYFLVFFII